MVRPVSIHHINFIVSDLAASVRDYQKHLGLGEFVFEDLPLRGARTARVKVGDTWIVLVSPIGQDSVPGKFLAENGEGIFLLSFGVNNLDEALRDYQSRGLTNAGTSIRGGLSDWRVADLDTKNRLGVQFHLTELTDSTAKP